MKEIYEINLLLDEMTPCSDKEYTTRSSAIAVITDRTACSILTLFIAITTYRPLNKKIRSLSVRGSNNYCGSASAIRSPHTCSRTVHGKRAMPIRLVCLSPLDTYGVSHVFCGAFCG